MTRMLVAQLVAVGALIAVTLGIPSSAWAPNEEGGGGYNYMRWTYGWGTFGWSWGWPRHQDSNVFQMRAYNEAYRSGGCGSGFWEVHYRAYPGNYEDITWRVESNCSPTSQGQTTGPRESHCIQNAPQVTQGSYNCDTTRIQ
jgi:hypothetical protein